MFNLFLFTNSTNFYKYKMCIQRKYNKGVLTLPILPYYRKLSTLSIQQQKTHQNWMKKKKLCMAWASNMQISESGSLLDILSK